MQRKNTIQTNKQIKKINALRTNYRKEKRKISQSLQSGAGADTVYTPSLWYYPLLQFLDDPETPRRSTSNFDDPQDQNEEHEIGLEGLDEDSAPPTPEMKDTFLRKEDTPATKTSHRNLARPTKRSTDKCDSVLGAIEDHFKKPKPAEDRYDVLGKHAAEKMRAVQDNIQRILAEKIISDALFMAEMGQLTMTHSIQQPSPTYSR
ncbi:uncharacterized protein LOC135203599 [Macrobrachium nipponense]|uniref:uncharacterized protein LOC135203599 n=1 Tax=Macrobrachium nipponense TaxID=159736 RepID=UPI0030C8660C